MVYSVLREVDFIQNILFAKGENIWYTPRMKAICENDYIEESSEPWEITSRKQSKERWNSTRERARHRRRSMPGRVERL